MEFCILSLEVNMKTVNVTFSIPENINFLLHSFVEKRGLSKFVTKAKECSSSRET